METDPDLEHFGLPFNNTSTPELRRADLDHKRLKELHRLAGLKYDPAAADSLMKDLAALETLASNLPQISQSDPNSPAVPVLKISNGQKLEMDRKLVEENAPQKNEGFYEMPTTAREHEEEIS